MTKEEAIAQLKATLKPGESITVEKEKQTVLEMLEGAIPYTSGVARDNLHAAIQLLRTQHNIVLKRVAVEDMVTGNTYVEFYRGKRAAHVSSRVALEPTTTHVYEYPEL
jgi:hypothetical protein